MADLTKTLKRAEQAQADGKPFPASVSLDPGVAIAAIKVAIAERRDLSNLTELALAEYTGRKAAVPLEPEELGKLVAAAARSLPGLRPEIEQLIARATRRARRRVAA